MPTIQKPRPPASGSASVGLAVVVKLWVKLTPARRSCPAWRAAWALIEPEPAKKSLTANAERRRLERDLHDGAQQPERGSGLAGLADRVASAGGVLRLDSPPGAGTRLEADIPCP